MKKITLILMALIALASFGQVMETDSVTSKMLDDLVVSGETPNIKAVDGIMTVNLTDIVKEKPVSNVFEALGYLPGVIEKNGVITLAGASSVAIILNGELNDMPIENLYQLLNSIPIERLKNVEVMYTAPPKYHINGAVINIVLKTPNPLDGLQGQIRGVANYAHFASYTVGTAATYAINDFAFDFNYNLSKMHTWANQETLSSHTLDDTRTIVEDNMSNIGKYWNNLLSASISWKSIKLTYNGQMESDTKSWSHSFGTPGNYTNKHDYQLPASYHNLSLRYKAPFGITFEADYTRYSETRVQSLFRENNLILSSKNRQHIDRYRIYIDGAHKLGRCTLTYGSEFQHSSDNSSQIYLQNEFPDFDDIITENIANAYLGIEKSFNWGLSFNVSAKGEYYHSNYQNNWNFIPQLGTTFSKTPKHIFQLNLTTQRIYPSFWELHGGTSYINDYSKVLGNPDLQPSIRYSTQLNYIFKQKFVATFYFQFCDKAMVQLPYQSPNELKLLFQTINMDYKSTMGLNLYGPFNIGKTWDLDATVNIFNQREKANRFHDIGFDNGKWIFYGSVDNTIKFSPNCPISLSLDFAYISPSLQGIANLSGLWSLDMGAKWQFGKKKCCELNLKATDIFNRWSPTMTIKHAGQDYRMKVNDMTRNLKLTFIWRFNGFKPKDTSTDTSRFGISK